MNYRLAYAIAFNPWETRRPTLNSSRRHTSCSRARRAGGGRRSVPRSGPRPRGASREEIEAVFPGWTITAIEASYFEAPEPIELMLKPDEHWYRLRRR